MIEVAVIGAKGRMGARVCEAVQAAQDLALVASLGRGDEITRAALAGARVAVDFTVPEATEGNVHAALDAGSHVVVGTSGWDASMLARVREHAGRAGLGVVVAPNFALSAVLTMAFARIAARWFDSAEVIEAHHPDKIDAPSGTALATAQGIARARRAAGRGPMPDATASDPLGARGARVEGVPVHSVRLRGLVAHQAVLFGNPGEQLMVRTDSFDRSSFMPGVLLAVRHVAERPGLTVGLDALLGL